MDQRADLLLVTVNDHETKALLRVFKKAVGHDAKPIPIGDRLYRYLGTINGTRTFHALSEMGSSGPGAAQQTVDKGIRALSPEAVIGVGIAFGVNEKKQTIGDILLSKQLRLYDLQRAGRKIILRGDRPHASTRLINFFEGIAQSSWKGAKVWPGVILSGDKLIDNLDYRNQLLEFESEAVGGEMEGTGVYVASHDHKVDWIVIKAICDWADGKKSKNKRKRQQKAAINAAEFVLYSLQLAQLATHTDGFRFSLPDNWTFRKTVEAIAKTERKLVVFEGFSDTELNAKLSKYELEYPSPIEALADLGHLARECPIRDYDVFIEGNKLYFKIRNKRQGDKDV